MSKRFSDSCDVVRCILDFYNEMAATERRYSASINKLLESASYTFHSNVLTQWLGNDPYEEIGYAYGMCMCFGYLHIMYNMNVLYMCIVFIILYVLN